MISFILSLPGGVTLNLIPEGLDGRMGLDGGKRKMLIFRHQRKCCKLLPLKNCE